MAIFLEIVMYYFHDHFFVSWVSFFLSQRGNLKIGKMSPADPSILSLTYLLICSLKNTYFVCDSQLVSLFNFLVLIAKADWV